MSSKETSTGDKKNITDNRDLHLTTGMSCGECHKLDDNPMVQCDDCDAWYHFDCVNVTDGIANVSWSCKHCDDVQHRRLSQQQQERQYMSQQLQYLSQQQQNASSQLQQHQLSQQQHTQTRQTPVTSTPTQDDMIRLNRDLATQLNEMEQRLAAERDEHRKQMNQMQQLMQRLELKVQTTQSMAPEQAAQRYTGTIKKSVNIEGAVGLPPATQRSKSHCDKRSQSSKQSIKLHEYQLKALEAKQSLERRQLEERLQLEKSILAASEFDSEEDVNEADAVLKINQWLEKTEDIGRSDPTVAALDETSLPRYELYSQQNNIAESAANSTTTVTLTNMHLAARQTVKDLPRFGGDPEDWPRFIAAYNRTTRMCAFSNDELLDRLERSLHDRALAAVKSLLLHPENVPTIMSRLRVLFGNPEVIVETMIKRIRAMPPPKTDRMGSIIDFGVAVQNLCSTIEACQMKEYLYNVALLHEFTGLLPAAMKMNWALHRQTMQSVTLKDFSSWVGNLVEALSKVTGPAESSRHSSQEKRRYKEEAYVHTHADPSPEHESKPCVVCGGPCISIAECKEFLGMDLQSRWTLIKLNKICRKCLNRHFSACEVNKVCNKNGCTYLHHPLLHDESRHRSARQVSNQPTTIMHTGVGSSNNVEHSNSHYCCLGSVLLKYVRVILYGRGVTIETFAFIDEGSSCTLIEHGLWEELRMTGTAHPLCISWTGGHNRYEKDSIICAVEISGVQGQTKTRSVMKEVHTVKSLQLPMQSVYTADLTEHYKHLVGVPIDSYRNVRPRILIGMDNIHLVRLMDCREGGKYQPVAAETPLGWVVYGPCSTDERKAAKVEHSFHICECETLHNVVKDYFSFDSIGIQATKPLLSKADDRALELLRTNTKLRDNKYETSLLWKYDDFTLPDSRPMALKRYECLERRMTREPELAAAMDAKLRDYVEKGYIRELTKAEERATYSRVWYLPIFPVYNANKPGKLRIVWDAAAVARGSSLNSFLLKGPDQVASLVAVLQRFREFRVGISADIREMFLQVAMNQEDQQCQRFFWKTGLRKDEPSVFVVQVMTFGATCSPSSAQFVKNSNAQRFVDQFPKAVEVIVEDHYVDDLLCSVETEEEALDLIRQIRFIHGQAGFEIRGWMSNSTVVTEALKDSPAIDKNLNVEAKLATEKVLGLWWDTASDMFTFRLSIKHDQELLSGTKVPTKREVLRTLMTVFDPLGFLGNLLMFLKILLQEIWRSGVQWDQQIGDEQFEKWRRWLKELSKVESVSIPRCYRLLTSPDATNTIQLHIFVDASIDGYAAVAYFRFEEKGNIECSLITSKTRVAPLKFVSIPRLELQAAVIGARLARSIAETHKLQIKERYFWTDSRDVLFWLASDHRRFTQFVGFRVGEILETTDVSEWNWLRSRENVADKGTKWQKAPDLAPSSRWFCGPDFLWKPIQEWPGKPSDPYVTEQELQRTMNHHSVVENVVNFEDFSGWWRLVRRIVFIQRFPTNIRRKQKGLARLTGAITQDELLAAEGYIFRRAQLAYYANEIRILELASQSDRIGEYTLPKSSSLYSLSPYVDENGIIRMSGRTRTCKYIGPYASSPIILPR